ncbi:LysR family transcriptional regulator substrate-binding protein [Peribacillus sp. NPDC097295]|uniref:LysR family transcriptional regulator substrate-binding protein n=1 Tax=Peribacillus sp. NPDC097295 TaxID=3364402 RepID=UPI0038191277
MGLVVSHDHKLANRCELEIKDLQDESFILTEKGYTYRAFLFEKLNENTISHTISMELSSVETIKKAVNNHWGIGFLPLFSVEEKVFKTIPLSMIVTLYFSDMINNERKKVPKAPSQLSTEIKTKP